MPEPRPVRRRPGRPRPVIRGRTSGRDRSRGADSGRAVVPRGVVLEEPDRRRGRPVGVGVARTKVGVVDLDLSQPQRGAPVREHRATAGRPLEVAPRVPGRRGHPTPPQTSPPMCAAGRGWSRRAGPRASRCRRHAPSPTGTSASALLAQAADRSRQPLRVERQVREHVCPAPAGALGLRRPLVVPQPVRGGEETAVAAVDVGHPDIIPERALSVAHEIVQLSPGYGGASCLRDVLWRTLVRTHSRPPKDSSAGPAHHPRCA